jgi:AraC-like DNA-binding protein
VEPARRGGSSAGAIGSTAEDLAVGRRLGEDRIQSGGVLGADVVALFRMSETSTSGQRHTVPIGLVSQLTQLVKRWDVSPSRLMAAVGLEERILEDPFLRIPVSTMCALLEQARTMTGEPGLGYYLGLHTRATLYGYLGFAMLSASTVGDALNLALQFAPIFSTALAVDLRIEGRIASLVFEERADLGSVRDIVLISMIIGMRELGRASTGRDTGGSADFSFPEPAYCARFAHLALHSRFDQPVNRIRFDAAVLNYPIITGDPVAREIARIQCERELSELGMGVRLADRVRRLLADDDSSSLEAVASQLELSPRTLRRRLASEGVSFSTLADQRRRDEALRLLRSSRLSIEDVARQLGYTNASTFVRAFHRWTGQTPKQYRRGAGVP